MSENKTNPLTSAEEQIITSLKVAADPQDIGPDERKKRSKKLVCFKNNNQTN